MPAKLKFKWRRHLDLVMKIKQLPEDFIVEEVSSRSIKAEGPFQIFLLEKKGLDTFGAKRIIGKEFKISNVEMGIAGLKDRHAVTRQYISFPSRFRIPSSWSQKSISLEKKGFSDVPIQLGEFQANRFLIVVRDIKEDEAPVIMGKSNKILQQGVPNYFDNQRFGSLRGSSAFIAKKLITGDIESALRIVLTSTSRHDPAVIRRCRKSISLRWKDWDSCLDACKEAKQARRETRIISHLKDHPADFKGAFLLIERELQKMYIAAYQSFLWNESAKVLLARAAPALALREIEYHAGSLAFPKDISQTKVGLLSQTSQTTIPLLNPGLEFRDEQVKYACLNVLKEEGIALGDLVVPGFGELCFKDGVRPMWVFPKSVLNPSLSKDELNSTPSKERKKLTLCFELPPGSYATIVLKAMGIVKKSRK